MISLHDMLWEKDLTITVERKGIIIATDFDIMQIRYTEHKHLHIENDCKHLFQF